MMKLNRTMLMGCAVVAALSFGCTRDEGVTKTGGTSTPAAGTAGTPADTRATSDKAPLTLTGCLQKTGGITGDYILAQATTGKGIAPVGTSGSAESNDAVGQRQLNAERSYRLSGEGSGRTQDHRFGNARGSRRPGEWQAGRRQGREQRTRRRDVRYGEGRRDVGAGRRRQLQQRDEREIEAINGEDLSTTERGERGSSGRSKLPPPWWRGSLFSRPFTSAILSGRYPAAFAVSTCPELNATHAP